MRWFNSLGRWTDDINMRLADRRLRRLRSEGLEEGVEDVLKSVTSPDPDPVLLHVYFNSVFWGWSLLTSYFLFFVIGVAFLGDKLDGHRGRMIGLGIGMFPVVACLVGETDAIWRQRCAKVAERRFLSANRTMDARSERLVTIARANTATILLQVGVGAAVAIAIALS